MATNARAADAKRLQNLKRIMELLHTLRTVVSIGKTDPADIGRQIGYFANELADSRFDAVEEATRRWARANKFWPTLADLVELVAKVEAEMPAEGGKAQDGIGRLLTEARAYGWDAPRIGPIAVDASRWLGQCLREGRSTVDMVQGLERLERAKGQGRGLGPDPSFDLDRTARTLCRMWEDPRFDRCPRVGLTRIWAAMVDRALGVDRLLDERDRLAPRLGHGFAMAVDGWVDEHRPLVS